MKLPDGTWWLTSWRTENRVRFNMNVVIKDAKPFHAIFREDRVRASWTETDPVEDYLIDSRVDHATSIDQIASFFGDNNQARDMRFEAETIVMNEASRTDPEV